MKIIYEVNGKQYESLEKAQEAEKIATAIKNAEILTMANKYHEIFTMIQAISIIPNNNNLAEVKIVIKERRLLPNYYVSKIYYSILIKLLKEYKIPYSANITDKYSVGILEVYAPNSKVESIPSPAIFEIYIKDYLRKEEEK